RAQEALSRRRFENITPINSGWSIAVVQPGLDQLAHTALRNRAYQVYRPIIPIKTKMPKGGLKTSFRSMFPGYLFVIDRTFQGWEALRTAYGMQHGDRCMLRSGGRTATLSTAIVDQIRGAEIDRNTLKIGQKVTIKLNPVTELLATIFDLDLDDNGR